MGTSHADSKDVSSPPWPDRLWIRVPAGLVAAFACGYMVYGAAYTECYRARGVELKFKAKLDGFGYSARPILGKNGVDAAKGKEAIDLYESVARGGGVRPSGVSEGPSAFFFGLGSQLGIGAGLFLLAFTVLLWLWWMGRNFGLWVLLVFAFGYGILAVVLSQAAQGKLVFTGIAAIIPILTFVAAMLVQRRKASPNASVGKPDPHAA